MNFVQKFVVLSSVASFVVAPVALATEDSVVKPDDNKVEKVTLTAEQRTCVVTALTKRENALVTAEQAWATAWKTALETRRDSLALAWGKESRRERLVAQRAAVAAFQTSKRAARNAEVAARKSAWDTYKTERRTCSPKATREDLVPTNLDI